jgi:hypothetical protein
LLCIRLICFYMVKYYVCKRLFIFLVISLQRYN